MNRLTEHLREIDESYWQHMWHALGFAAAMFAGSLACLLHAVFPFLFIRTGSSCIEALHNRMVVNRDKLTPHHRRPSARRGKHVQSISESGVRS